MSDNKNNEIKAGRGKTNGYNSSHLHAKRNRKRQEAEARKANHDYLTVEEKISKALKRRGESKREVARLMAQVKITEPKKQLDTILGRTAPVTEAPKAKRKTVAKKK